MNLLDWLVYGRVGHARAINCRMTKPDHALDTPVVPELTLRECLGIAFKSQKIRDQASHAEDDSMLVYTAEIKFKSTAAQAKQVLHDVLNAELRDLE
jgi:hypothetical protein